MDPQASRGKFAFDGKLLEDQDITVVPNLNGKALNKCAMSVSYFINFSHRCYNNTWSRICCSTVGVGCQREHLES